MVYAVRGKGHVDPGRIDLPERLQRLAPLLSGIAAYGHTRKRVHDPSALTLTDDRAPLERLCDEDLLMRSAELIVQAKEIEP